MTALHALRLAAAEQPEGDLKRLLTWAEMHIGDQYERQGKRRRCFSAVSLTDVLAVFEKSALVGRQWTENE